ncbi:hypothetical protein ACODT5_15380 [Streptomyces sp. 5.8]|uniref:hypothetical protein n=1 Tax=Streptomyces sp. 5.8 TaxID=3406571 RepID=UPI003BB58000
MPARTLPVEDFTDVNETALRLGIGVRRLRDGVNHHGYPHHRMGRKLRFSPQDRAEIAEMHRVPARPRRLRARAA